MTDDESIAPNRLPESEVQPACGDQLTMPGWLPAAVSAHGQPPSPPRPENRRDSHKSCYSTSSRASVESSGLPQNGQVRARRKSSSPVKHANSLPGKSHAIHPPTSRFMELLRCLAEEHERVVSQTNAALMMENMALNSKLHRAHDLLMKRIPKGESSDKSPLPCSEKKKAGERAERSHRRDRAATTDSSHNVVAAAAAAARGHVKSPPPNETHVHTLPSLPSMEAILAKDTGAKKTVLSSLGSEDSEYQHEEPTSSRNDSRTGSLPLWKWRRALDVIKNRSSASCDPGLRTTDLPVPPPSQEQEEPPRPPTDTPAVLPVANSQEESSPISPTGLPQSETLSGRQSTRTTATSGEQATAPASSGDGPTASCMSSSPSPDSRTSVCAQAESESVPKPDAVPSQGGGDSEALPTLLKSDSPKTGASRFSIAMRHMTAFKRHQQAAQARTTSSTASSRVSDESGEANFAAVLSAPASPKSQLLNRRDRRSITVGHFGLAHYPSSPKWKGKEAMAGAFEVASDESKCVERQITLLSHWQKLLLRSPLTSHHLHANRLSRSWVLSQQEQLELQRLVQAQSLWARISTKLIVRPGSKLRISWDFFGMTLILYDLVTIPMQIFETPKHVFSGALSTLNLGFWTLDIPFSFFTGFYREGVLEERLDQIARHYARTWLAFDIIVISVDWCLTIAGELSNTMAADSVGYMRFGKILRFLRMVRLLRLLKVHGLLSDLIERVHSEFCLIMLGIARVIVSIMLINHLIACSWYGIGTIGDAWEDTWVHQNGLQDKHLGYKYTIALHWSLTQFTPASMEVVPENTLERCFAVCVLLFAMVTFSSLVSSITNAMTQLRNLNSEHLDQTAMLRRYLGENKVSAALMGRIWGCMQQIMDKSRRKIHEKDVAILTLLPCTLKGDLQEEVYFPILATHPFFHQFASMFSMETRRIYQQALLELSTVAGQELFNAGDEASKMFFILSGTSRYTLEGENQQSLVNPGQFVSEAALWISWKHAGQLAASTHCELLAILSENLFAAVSEHGAPPRYAKCFAKHFQDDPSSLNDVFLDMAVLQRITDHAFAPDAEDDITSDNAHELQRHRMPSAMPATRGSFAEVLMGLVPPMPYSITDRRTSVNSIFNRLARGQSTPSIEALSQPTSDSGEELSEERSDDASSKSSCESNPAQASGVSCQVSSTLNGRSARALPAGPSVIVEETQSGTSSKVQTRTSSKASSLGNESLRSAEVHMQQPMMKRISRKSSAWS